jgi:hypothetical protein
LLAQTTLDEQLAEKLSTHYGQAKDFTYDALDKVSSADYAKHLETLKSHEVYVTHIAPHVDTATKVAQPYIDEYVNPAMEKANTYIAPALKTAKDDILPKLASGGSQALDSLSQAPQHLEKAGSFLDRILDRIFEKAARIAPKKADVLPTSTIDRLLWLFFTVWFSYHLFFLVKFLLRVCLYLTGTSVKLTVSTIRVAMIPVKIVRMLLGLWLWLGTCFYCCGLCRRKKAVADLSKKAEKQQKNGSTASPPDATVAEVVALLEKGKKENKLEAAAKQLVSILKKDKPMTAPANMVGRKLTKDVVAKALGKFKELDAKKLLG